VLATACANAEPRLGIDFFPLTVDYREYTYAGGRIPGGFIKREGRMSERETLTSRQIDRPIRPLFPKASVMRPRSSPSSSRPTRERSRCCRNQRRIRALTISDIPFAGPIGAVRVGLVNDEFIINPTYAEQHESKLNIMVVGTAEGIVMIEAGANEVDEDRVVDAIEFAHTEIKKICAVISEFAQKRWQAEAQIRSSGRDRSGLPQRSARQGRRSAGRCGQHREVHQDRQLREDQGPEGLVSRPRFPKTSRKRAQGRQVLRRMLRELVFREEVTKNRRVPMAAPSIRFAPSGAKLACCRALTVPRLYPWRNSGTGYHHAWHQRRHAAPRTLRRRNQEALHAALQLPAVLGW
jgi:polyribonucleotide nucleotidyltransferase